MTRPTRHLVPLTATLAGVLALAAGCGTTHVVQISRHESADIGEARADQILADATLLLQAWDGPGDDTCPTGLTRKGPVTVFSDGDGSVDSEKELDEVIAAPGRIKVVKSINWCNGIAPDIKGCTRLGGKGVVVTRAAIHQEGVIWAHEFGHSKGLPHRDADGALMDPKLATLHRRVNKGECDALRKE